MRRFLFILALLGLPLAAQTHPIAVQGVASTVTVGSTPQTFTGPDVARTGYPVFFPYMFPDGAAGITSTSTLGLSGMNVSAGQFTPVAWWPSGKIQVVWGRAIVDYDPAGTAASKTLTLTTSGTGNFGGSNLAVDNAKITGTTCEAAGTSSGYICVNTGTAQFQIRKASYNVFDKVVVNGKVLVDSTVRASDGLTILGPPAVHDTNAVPAAPASAPTWTTIDCTGQTGCPTAARTYYIKTSYASTSGEGMASAASTVCNGTSTPACSAGRLLQVDSPGSTSGAAGWYVYVGASTGLTHLQQPTREPLSFSQTTWTEPLGCNLPLRSSASIASIVAANCQGTGGVLANTPVPQVFAVAGNDGILVGDGSNVTYKSSLDTNSTAAIDMENGPAMAMIKATGSLAATSKSCPAGSTDGTETTGCYLHYTQRMSFYKGQSFVEQNTILRNADYTPSSSANQTHQASDAKGFQSLKIRVALAGADISSANAKSYSIKANATNSDCSGQICTGTLTGDALLYQGYHPVFEYHTMNADIPDGMVQPLLAFKGNARVDSTYGNSAGRSSYAQEGFVIQANGAAVTSKNADADHENPGADVNGMGWADIRETANGRGVEIGTFYLASSYPNGLQFKNVSSNTYDAVIELLPDQTEPLETSTIKPQGAVPYYLAWPQHYSKRTFWNFHDTALATPDAEFAKYQQFLLGRPALKDVNDSKFFTELYPLIDPNVFDGYIANTVGGSMTSWKAPNKTGDFPIWYRYWDIRAAGEGNENEFGWAELMKWLQRGGAFSTSYLLAQHWYELMANEVLASSDFSGGWRGTCSGTCTALDSMGFPWMPGISGNASGGKYPSGNYQSYVRHISYATNDEHDHIFGMGEFALLSGDPGMIDAANSAWADAVANPNITKVAGFPSSAYVSMRAFGWAITNAAYGYRYFQSQNNSTDATAAQSKATSIISNQVPQTAYGFGFGSTKWGQSPVQGHIWNGSYDDGNALNGDDSACPVEPSLPNGRQSCETPGSPYGSGGGYRIWTSFMANIALQSLWSAVEAFGPGWSLYQKALDTIDGQATAFFAESGWVEHYSTTACTTGNSLCTLDGSGQPIKGPACYPGRSCSGPLYWLNLEFYNADKTYFLSHGTSGLNAVYFDFASSVLLSGKPDQTFTDPLGQTVGVRNAFHELLQLRGPGGAEDGIEEWSTAIGLFIDEDGNDPTISGKPALTKFTWTNLPGNPQTPGGHWIDVAFTGPSACAGQTACALTGASPGNLTWTAPASVVAYRMKMNQDAKAIVPWVSLDNITNPMADGSGCASRYTPTATSGNTAGIAPDTVSGASPYAIPGMATNHWWYGCWNDDPRYKWPWFSSGNVTNLPTSPLPTSFNPTTVEREGVAGAYQSAGQNSFALRAYVTSSVPTAYLTGNSPIIVGDSSTLQWTTSNVTDASIDQGIGTVPLNDSISVTPSATTTYTLTATGPNGTATSSFTVVVTAPPPVPTASLSVNPSTITAGNSATLSWATTDATAISISPGIGSVGASGTWTVTPAATTTYILTATGPGGTATAQTTLTVNPVIPPGATGTVVNGATVKGVVVQ